MADVAHSSTSITGGHTNAVAAGAAGFMSGTDKSNLDGLTSGSAQAVKKDGSVAFTAVQSGIDPTAPANLATRAYVDATEILVGGVTAGALNAYTLTPGTLGVGDVITSNTNVVFPTLADGATITVGAANGGDRFLLLHGASAADNRVWKLTAQGVAGVSAWSATAYDGCDTAAKIVKSKLRVPAQHGAAPRLYIYAGSASPTVNTTPLFWLQIDSNGTLNDVLRYREDFCQTIAPTNATMLAGSPILSNFLNGTGAAFAIEADNSAAVCGSISVTTGSSVANARGGWITSWVASATNPAEGFSIVMARDIAIHLECVVAVPVLSNASKEYKNVIGFIDAISASSAGAQVTPNGLYIQYDRTNSVNWAIDVTVGGVPSITAGSTAADTNYVHLVVHKDAGTNTARFFVAGVEVGSGFDTSGLNSTRLGFAAVVFSSVGTGAAVKAMKPDFIDITVAVPARRYS